MTVLLIIFAIVYLLVSFRFEYLSSFIEILIRIQTHIIANIIAIILTKLFKYSNFYRENITGIFVSHFKNQILLKKYLHLSTFHLFYSYK